MEKSNRGGRPIKRTEKEILQAIEGSAGIKSTIIKRLGITYNTFESYMDRYTSVREALRNEEESVLDMAEGNLFKLIQSGELSAIFYYLNNKGKRRGYGQIRKDNVQEESADDGRKTGVLETPGLLKESEWEAEAAKK